MVAYILAFVILDLITRQFEVLPGIVAWYPAAGLTYTLLLVFGVRFTPAVAIALFLSNMFIHHSPQPSYQLFLWALIISLIYSATAAFLRHRIHFDWQLRKLRDVVWFVFTTVLVSALLAILSVLGSALSSNMPQNDIFRAIFNWWIGETVGVLTVTPFMLIYVIPTLKRFTDRQPIRFPAGWSFPRPTLSDIVQVFSLVFTLYWVFGAPIPDEFRPLFLIALPLIWIALERGLKGASAAILLLNTGVVLAVWLFRFDSAYLAELELLMIIICVVGLLMGAVVTERKQVDKVLGNKDELLQLTSEMAKVGGWEFDTLTLEGTWTDEVARIHDLDPTNPTNVNLAISYYMPDSRIKIEQAIKEAIEFKQPYDLELQMISAKGNQKWVRTMGLPIIENGKVIKMRGIFQDINERKRNELIRDAIYRITQAVITSDGIDALYRSIHSILGELIPTENFFIALSDPVKGLISFPYYVDQYDEQPTGMTQVQGLTGYVIRTGRPLLATQEIFDRLVGQGEVEAVGTAGVDWMGAPLKVKGLIIGVMAVQSYTEGIHFHQEDLNLLEFVSTQVAQAIERKRMEEKLEQDRILMRTLIDNLPDRIYVMDVQGRKTLSNMADWQASGGKKMEDVIGKTDFDTYPPELAKDYWAIGKAVIETRIPIFNREEPGLDSEGNPVWVLSSKVPLSDGKEKIVGLVGIGHDITERKQAEDALHQSEAELRALFASMHDAVLVIDRAGVYRKIAPTSPELLIIPPQELLGKNVRNFFPFEQAEAFIRVMQQVLDTKQTAQIEYDVIIGERTLQFETTISPMTDDSTLWVAHDITKRKSMEEEIRNLSLTDELTGLYNRRGFTLLAEQELKLACRVKRNMLLLFCDVDGLKTINDSHGHAQGDLALKDISTILKKTFRETDIIARLGGDEFAVLDVDASMENAELLATRLHAVLEAHNRQAHQPYKLSFSVGIAHFDPETPCPVEDLIAQADALMYAQKLTGKRKQ